MFDFYKTRMGMTFFEGTMPSLVRELKRLNDNLEKGRELSERMLASQEAQDKYQRDLDAKNFHCDGCPGDCQTNHGLTLEGECGDPDLRGPHPRASDAGCHECIKASAASGEKPSQAVGREYVLNQLAGMEFPGKGQAYDFIKKCFSGF